MLHNLRYLASGQGVLDADEPPDPSEFGPSGEPLTEAAAFWADQQEQQEADAPPLSAAAAPQGYLSADPGDKYPSPTGPPMDLPSATPMRGPLPSATYKVVRPGNIGPEQGMSIKTPTFGSSNKRWIPNPSGGLDAVSSPIAPIAPLNEGDTPWVAGTDQPTTSDLPVKLPGSGIPGKDYGLQEALDTQRQIESRYPIRPVPKLLNRIGAGALGAAAGWSNAARRAAPIDTKALADAALYPGYDAKLANWQSQENAAKLQVENYGQQVGAQYTAQKAQSDAQLKFAQAKQAIERGDYWERRSEQERNQWKIGADGSLYNTISGQRVEKPPTTDAKYKAAMAITGGDKEKSAYYALNGKLPTPTQHNTSKEQMYLDANGGDPVKALAAQQRDAVATAQQSRDPGIASNRTEVEDLRSQAAIDKVNRDRLEDEHRILADRQAKLTQLTTSGQSADRIARTAEINRDAAAQLQVMHNNYADSVRRRGGTANDYDVNPVTLATTPRAAAGAASGAAAVTPPRQGQPPPASPTATPAAPATPQTGPIRVTLPDGSTKVFPDQKSLDAFAHAAGLTFSPAK